jgi:hypothetical protein
VARRVLNLLSALSLLLCMAASALWVRSRSTTDEVTWWSGNGLRAGAGRKLCFVSHTRGWLEVYREWPQDLKGTTTHGAVVATTALLPAGRFTIWVVGRTQSRRRTRRGHCPKCGYDLTANVSGVCPECGQARPSPLGHAGAEHAR